MPVKDCRTWLPFFSGYPPGRIPSGEWGESVANTSGNFNATGAASKCQRVAGLFTCWNKWPKLAAKR